MGEQCSLDNGADDNNKIGMNENAFGGQKYSGSKSCFGVMSTSVSDDDTMRGLMTNIYIEH